MISKIKVTSIFLLVLCLFGCVDKAQKNNSLKNDIGEIGKDFLYSSKNINNDKPKDKWWEEFNDEFLNQIIEIGLNQNKDIELANASIITARQLNNIDITALIPSGKIALERQRFASPAFGPSGVKYDLYQSLFDASWELDLLGKNLDRYKAGKLRFLEEVQIYKLNSIRIASEIAQNYIALKAKEKQIANLEEILKIRDDLDKIIARKEKQGVATKTEIYQNKIDYNNASSLLIAAKTEKKLITYRLAVLLSMTPEKTLQILADSNNKKQIFDYYFGVVPLGLKSDILKRRPDIVAAEYEIDATLYEKSAQFKEFFPSFNLTTRIGGGAKDVGDVLSNGANIKDIRGSVSLPILSMPQLIAQYKISKTKSKNALINYEKTILAAIADCESQLARYIDAIAIENNSFASKMASDKILQITKNKKLIGVVSTEEFLNSRISNLDSEINLAQKKSETLSYLIALHKAIGGGFDGYEMKFEKDKVQFVKND